LSFTFSQTPDVFKTASNQTKMKIKSYILNSLFIVAAAFYLQACDSNVGTASHETDRKDTIGDVATKPAGDTAMTNGSTANNDEQFIIAAAASDLVEIKSSEAASVNSTNKAVLDLAKMMIQEHTAMSRTTAELASSMNVTLPVDLPEPKKALLAKAASLKGSEFDREYVTQLINGHNEAINMLDRAAVSAAAPQVKTWASTALQKVRQHLQMITETQAKLK
jgi:putative membrane protein